MDVLAVMFHFCENIQFHAGSNQVNPAGNPLKTIRANDLKWSKIQSKLNMYENLIGQTARHTSALNPRAGGPNEFVRKSAQNLAQHIFVKIIPLLLSQIFGILL
jgi:hypothetical protein